MAMDGKFTNTRPWIAAGMLILTALVGGLGAWSAFAPISSAVIAAGQIGVESKIKTVQHLEGGTVEEIFVRDGDHVKAGDNLVRLDDTAIRANLAIFTDRLHELMARRARLEAERDGAEQVDFPSDLQQAASDEKVAKILSGARALFEARKRTRAGQIQVLNEQIVQLGEQVNGLEAQKQSRKQQSDILKENIERKRPAVEKGIVTVDAMDMLRDRDAELLGELGEIHSKIAEVRSTIEETKLNILQIDVQFREEILAELRDVQTAIAELQEKASATEQKLHLIDIRAPRDGIVHNMTIHTIGGVISPASPIMQIIPEGDRLIVEARIHPTDIDNVKVGQNADIRITALDTSDTPLLEGAVRTVSAAQLVDQKDGSSYFEADIEIAEDQLARLPNEEILVPGMPAEVFILTGERTALDILLKPFREAIERALRES